METWGNDCQHYEIVEEYILQAKIDPQKVLG